MVKAKGTRGKTHASNYVQKFREHNSKKNSGREPPSSPEIIHQICNCGGQHGKA